MSTKNRTTDLELIQDDYQFLADTTLIAVWEVAVSTPTVSGPSSDVTDDVEFSGSEFDGEGVHDKTDWLLFKATNLSSTVWESLNNTVNLTVCPSLKGVLEPATSYVLKFRYHDATNDVWSEYGMFEFTTAQAFAFVNSPTLTVEGAPDNVFETPRLTTSAFQVTGGSDSHQLTDWEIYKASGGSAVWQSLNDALNKTEITVPEDILVAGTAYRARARHKGAALGYSNWSEVQFTTAQAFAAVATPVISGVSEDVMNTQIFVGSEFEMTVSEGSHDKTDWILVKSSAPQVEVWSSKNDSSNLTVCPSLESVLEVSTTYILKVRYHDSVNDVWSDYGTFQFTTAAEFGYTITFNVDGGTGSVEAISVSPGETFEFPEYSGTKEGVWFTGWSLTQGQEFGIAVGTISEAVNSSATYYACWSDSANPELGNRVLTRHPNGQGTVVTFDMYGKTIHLFVADAKYRADHKAWGTRGIDIPTMDNIAYDIKYINPSNTVDDHTANLTYTLTDTQLQARYPSFKPDKTAKQNTDILMGYDDTDAAHHCREQTISGIGKMDLPNLYEMMILYLESDRIDELDPTVDSYPQYALGKKNTKGRFSSSYIWSSTECNVTNARFVGYTGNVLNYGKDGIEGVAPVSELSVFTPPAKVVTPTISGKTEGVTKQDTFTGSKFTMTPSGSEGTHDKSDWVLLEDLAEVWSSKDDTSNLTTCPSLESVLEVSKTYTLKVRYHDSVNDIWSDFGTFEFTTAEEFSIPVDPNLPQRVLERHSSGQGTVVTFDMYGKTVQLFVADAKYRATKAWGQFGTDIPTMDNFTSDINKYINPSNSEDSQTADLSYALTDTQLQSRFPSLKTDKTAKENTDILMGYADTEAAKHCRDQTISGVGRMDLPNNYELMVLYLESDRIDELDPTVDSYPQLALGKKNTYGRFVLNNIVHIWSSTEYSHNHARNVYYNGSVHGNGKNNTHGVVPVLELDVS